MKAEAALLIGLADIGEIRPLQSVTRALTDLADTAVRAAVRFFLRDAAARGKLDPRDPAQPEQIPVTSCWRWARWAPSS